MATRRHQMTDAEKAVRDATGLGMTQAALLYSIGELGSVDFPHGENDRSLLKVQSRSPVKIIARSTITDAIAALAEDGLVATEFRGPTQTVLAKVSITRKGRGVLARLRKGAKEWVAQANLPYEDRPVTAHDTTGSRHPKWWMQEAVMAVLKANGGILTARVGAGVMPRLAALLPTERRISPGTTRSLVKALIEQGKVNSDLSGQGGKTTALVMVDPDYKVNEQVWDALQRHIQQKMAKKAAEPATYASKRKDPTPEKQVVVVKQQAEPVEVPRNPDGSVDHDALAAALLERVVAAATASPVPSAVDEAAVRSAVEAQVQERFADEITTMQHNIDVLAATVRDQDDEIQRLRRTVQKQRETVAEAERAARPTHQVGNLISDESKAALDALTKKP